MKFDGVIISENHDPYYNLSMEETLLDDPRNLIMIWRNGPSVIIGRHQNTYKEVDYEYVKKEHVPVVRRLTGGGAVYHDHGNLNISFAFDLEDFDEQVEYCSERLIKFLKFNGIDAFFSGRNDICVIHKQEKYKLSGCAMIQRGNRGLFHATLLFAADINEMERILTPDISKLKANGTDSVRSRVINIKSITDKWIDTEAFEADIIEYLGADKLQPNDEKIKELIKSRYSTWEWNYGRDPECDLSSERKFKIGLVGIKLSIKGGIIKTCSFTGDYIDAGPLEKIAEALIGLKHDRESIIPVVSKYDCSRYFGVDNKEVVEFIMKGK